MPFFGMRIFAHVNAHFWKKKL